MPGGTQLTLLPWSIICLAAYTVGYPAIIGYTLWRNLAVVMEDQLLRAHGVGGDKLSGPRTYAFRTTFSRVYFAYKPDWAPFWFLAIIFRKFLIALVGLMFNRTASFQLAASLLVCFVAFAAQVYVAPYMGPAEYENVLRSHNEAAFTSDIHSRLRAAISQVKTRAKRKSHRNALVRTSTVDPKAVLGVLTSWAFSYNVVESTLLFSAVIVTLMGILYDAAEASPGSYTDSKDAVTAVIMITIIVTLIYFFTVVVTEVVVMWNEGKRREDMEKRPSSARKSVMQKSGDNSKGGGVGASEGGEINVGAMDNTMNPLHMSADPSTGNSLRTAIESMREPPSAATWAVIRDNYQALFAQLDSTQDQVRELKLALQSSAAKAEDSSAPTITASSHRIKHTFRPQDTEAGRTPSALQMRKGSSPAMSALAATGFRGALHPKLKAVKSARTVGNPLSSATSPSRGPSTSDAIVGAAHSDAE